MNYTKFARALLIGICMASSSDSFPPLNVVHKYGSKGIRICCVRSSMQPADLLTFETFLGDMRYYAQDIAVHRFAETNVGTKHGNSDPRDLAPSQAAREKLLCMRISDLGLNRVRVGESSLSGRGVFAQRDLNAGELITCYPGDALVYAPTGGIVWGLHVPAASRDPRRCAEGTACNLLDYGLEEDGNAAMCILYTF